MDDSDKKVSGSWRKWWNGNAAPVRLAKAREGEAAGGQTRAAVVMHVLVCCMCSVGGRLVLK